MGMCPDVPALRPDLRRAPLGIANADVVAASKQIPTEMREGTLSGSALRSTVESNVVNREW